MKKISFWQLLFYFSWAVLTFWLILKITGVIKTPLWLEYGVPLGGLILGIFGLYQNILESIGKLTVQMTALTMKVDHLDKDAEILKKDIGLLKDNVSILRKELTK